MDNLEIELAETRYDPAVLSLDAEQLDEYDAESDANYAAEYEERLTNENGAMIAVKHAERLLDWIKGLFR